MHMRDEHVDDVHVHIIHTHTGDFLVYDLHVCGARFGSPQLLVMYYFLKI